MRSTFRIQNLIAGVLAFGIGVGFANLFRHEPEQTQVPVLGPSLVNTTPGRMPKRGLACVPRDAHADRFSFGPAKSIQRLIAINKKIAAIYEALVKIRMEPDDRTVAKVDDLEKELKKLEAERDLLRQSLDLDFDGTTKLVQREVCY